jgi:hypothetical protein
MSLHAAILRAVAVDRYTGRRVGTRYDSLGPHCCSAVSAVRQRTCWRGGCDMRKPTILGIVAVSCWIGWLDVDRIALLAATRW